MRILTLFQEKLLNMKCKFLENNWVSWRIDFSIIFNNNLKRIESCKLNKGIFIKKIFFRKFLKIEFLENFWISWRIEFLKNLSEIIFKSRVSRDYLGFLAKNICPKNPTENSWGIFHFLGELNYDFVLKSSITVFTNNSPLKSL